MNNNDSKDDDDNSSSRRRSSSSNGSSPGDQEQEQGEQDGDGRSSDGQQSRTQDSHTNRDRLSSSIGEPVIISTKTYDGGGGRNYTRPQQPDHQTGQGQAEEVQQRHSGEGDDSTGRETATTSSTATTSTVCQQEPDSFQIYSDTDTRMAELLGLEPASNPNDGEERENWRDIVGFQGLGGRPRQEAVADNDNEEEDGNRNREAEARSVPVSNNDNGNENGDTTTMPARQTRMSWEVHSSVFANMWWQRGELGPPIDEDDLGLDDVIERLQQQQLQQNQQQQNQQHQNDDDENEGDEEEENSNANGQGG